MHECVRKNLLGYLCHDLWVWVLNGVSPFHSHHISPYLHLAAHQPASCLCGRFVILILQKAEASIFFLVIRLMI